MSDEHDHPHSHGEPVAGTPRPQEPMVDSGSRAVDEALRSSFVAIKVVMVALLVLFVCSGITRVGPEERAIVLRFGRPTSNGPEELLGPGLYFAFPYPIDEVVKIKVKEIQTVTSTAGWWAVSAGQEALNPEPPVSHSLNPAIEGYELTSDTNILHIRATLRFRITDPLAYAFNFVNYTNAVQAVLNGALVYAAAHSSVDDALVNQAALREKVVSRVNEQIDLLKLGITLDPLDIEVKVPGWVRADFAAVVGAEQDKNKAIEAAQSAAETMRRNADATATLLLDSAQAERLKYVSAVAAEADSFTNQLPQYLVNPELFRRRVLAEAWDQVLVGVRDKFISLEPVHDNQTQLRVLINREPKIK